MEKRNVAGFIIQRFMVRVHVSHGNMAQWVRAVACRAEGGEFEPHYSRWKGTTKVKKDAKGKNL